jgi:uncharacterized protein YwqG
MTIDELIARAIEHGFTDLERIRAWARDSVELTLDPTAGGRARDSRLGGLPALPATIAWPAHDGRPLAFIAQIDLATLPSIAARAGVPADGLLLFFYDAVAQPWGYQPSDAGKFAVVYVADAQQAVVAGTWPDDLPEEVRFPHCGLVPEVTLTLPANESLLAEEDPISAELEDAYLELLQALYVEGERCLIGGHPDQIQGEMQLECALVTAGIECGGPEGYRDPRMPALRKTAHEWRLLLQIPSASWANMMWGDGGSLFVWIRESDLRARRFDRTWVILQCG